MPRTAKLPEIVLMQTCPGCMRSLPYTLEHFDFCLLCDKVFCHKCMRTCILCGRTRCYICIEHITDKFKTSGMICEKCAMFLNHKEGRTSK